MEPDFRLHTCIREKITPLERFRRRGRKKIIFGGSLASIEKVFDKSVWLLGSYGLKHGNDFQGFEID